eukprot:617179-Rhodomonas_salina.1
MPSKREKVCFGFASTTTTFWSQLQISNRFEGPQFNLGPLSRGTQFDEFPNPIILARNLEFHGRQRVQAITKTTSTTPGTRIPGTRVLLAVLPLVVVLQPVPGRPVTLALTGTRTAATDDTQCDSSPPNAPRKRRRSDSESRDDETLSDCHCVSVIDRSNFKGVPNTRGDAHWRDVRQTS